MLILEHIKEDVAPIVSTLKYSGIKFTYHVADSEVNYRKIIKNNIYDAILSDYDLADFNVFQALKLIKQSGQ